MRFASYRIQGRAAYGLVHEGSLLEPHDDFCARFPDLRSVLEADALAEAKLAAQNGVRHSIDTVAFEPVIPYPGKILCVGANYLSHMKEMGRAVPEYPWLFVRFSDSQVGHEQPMIRPTASQKYDFEGELAVIIGREARHVASEDALDYVAGYSCFNDGTLRDFQDHGSQFTPGKNFYHSGSFGPWLVTVDEIPDPTRLTLETRLNGQAMQAALISDLRFGIGELIEYCSTFSLLRPGDVISTGTTGGVGFARKPPVWMQPGDVIEVEISGIGVLRNRIADEA
jgi:2-keto-4-pentenoate hydratase/2-oxohepta-3-ene-1,7-dioic acid hydratase in catechol pathway